MYWFILAQASPLRYTLHQSIKSIRPIEQFHGYADCCVGSYMILVLLQTIKAAVVVGTINFPASANLSRGRYTFSGSNIC